MSLVLNVYNQFLPLRENFRAFVLSLHTSKTKQNLGVRLSKETLTCIVKRCVSFPQTKKRAEIETFLLLQSRCKSEHFCGKIRNQFEFRHFEISKVQIVQKMGEEQTNSQIETATFSGRKSIFLKMFQFALISNSNWKLS